MEKDQAFVEMVVRELVENPDAVKVERKVDEMGVLITLTVDPADMGKIIGKEGRTAKAIRTLLRVLGARNNSRVNLKIEEPEGSTYVPREESGEQVAVTDDAVEQPMPEPQPEAAPVTPIVQEPENENPTSIL